MKTSRSFRKKLVSASVASAIGLAVSGPLNADTFEISFVGGFTMLNNAGGALPNQATDYVLGYNDPYLWYGNRTPITGTMTYDDVAGTGAITINGFLFFGLLPQNIALARNTSIRAIGNGTCTNDDPAQGCQPGNLLLGNLLFDWNFTVGIPVSIVWDAQGMLGALPSAVPGTVIDRVGVLSASNDTNFGGATAKKPPKFFPIGPIPVAATTWDTTPLCTEAPHPDTVPHACLDVNPSGKLPLVPDTISGSPMIDGPFQFFNANFDFMKLTVTKKNGVPAEPNIQLVWPGNGDVNIAAGSPVAISFTRVMNTISVTNAFNLKDAGGVNVAGTLTTVSPDINGNAQDFRYTPTNPLAVNVTYTASVAATAQDDDNGTPLTAPMTWQFSTGAAVAGPGPCTPVLQKPVGSNFTMLSSGGIPIGGTNDIEHTIDLANLNTNITHKNFNMTLKSMRPQPFEGFVWTAHHIRAFGPGTYAFNTACTTAQLETGTCTPNADSSKNLNMTVGTGQIGAHMLFDWNVTTNIDVVNIWDQNSTWDSKPDDPRGTNDLFVGEYWAGPAGLGVNPATLWQYVSTDNDGNGFHGVPMIDGPFQGFHANFNLGPTDSCTAQPPKSFDIDDPSSFSGCSIGTNPSSPSIFKRAEWLLVGGFLAFLGVWRRFRTRRASKA